MARLQRKKTVNQKKKKKIKADNLTIDGQSATSEKKPGAKLDAGKEAKKKASQAKKTSFVSKTVKKQKKEETFIDKSMQFLREVKGELKQVVWPTKNQTIVSTVVVIILVMILSGFLGLVDTGLNFVMRLLLQ